MSTGHRQATPSTAQACYPQTLIQAINQHLPCGLFDRAGTGLAVRWCQRYLTLCAVLMAWSMAETLADRFEGARRSLVKMFPGRRRPGNTYQGFVAALATRSEGLLARVSDHLRGQVRTVALAAGQWEHLGFVPIGVDGSKVECPKTLANEKHFGCAGKNRSTPQQFVTTLLHLPTGVVWEFVTGEGCSSEREHLRQMLPTLPTTLPDGPSTLLIADAGFTGYALLAAILDDGHSFLIRVGSNVRLLTKLGWALEERQGTVYLWPDAMRKKKQPPLVLRLITLLDGRNRRMHLLSNVSDPAQLSDPAACQFYTMRWGVELHYRALKQTLRRRKLASDAPANAQMELRWAMTGLWLLGLMTACAIGRSGSDVRRLSVATALRRVRSAMQAPARRCGSAGLGRQLARALKDCYVRAASKRARDWAHRKKPKPIGDPKARIADASQAQEAYELRQRALAA